MKIDVVIPLYNGKKWIAETLESIFAQSLKPQRIIVVDNCSTDGSREIVERIPGVVLLNNSEKGEAATRNVGLRYSSAPFVAFLDQDDIWHKDHLKILADMLIQNPDAPFSASRLVSFCDGSSPKFDFSDVSCEFISPWDVYPTHGLACTPSGTLFRRKDLIEIGGWPSEYDAISDYLVWLKLSLKKPLIITNAKTVGYRRHQSSYWMSIRKWNSMAYIELLRKADNDLMDYYLKHNNTESDKENIKRRNKVAHYSYELIETLIKDNGSILPNLARGLEKIVAHDDDNFKKRVFKHIHNLLILCFCPGFNSAEIKNYSITLLEKWPSDARKTYSALQDVIIKDRPGLNFYKKCFLKKELGAKRFSLVISALCAKFAICKFSKYS